ncbi:MAG TPA: serine O-acetyltransferase [Phycisphaerae bacterium]|nr:serine O-acetyltransferase [Phycisphaerae bacterium]
MADDAVHFQSLVQAIVASYKEDPRTRHIDAGHLPNRDAVIELLELLRELLFPGYFGKQNLTNATLDYHVGDLIGTIRERLFAQVRSAIRHQATRRGEECPSCDATAEVIVQEFLGTLPALRAMLATDVQAAFDGDPAAGDTDEIIFSYPGLFAISVYRIAHELHRADVPLIPRIMTEYAHNLTGIDIHPGATIGEYFFIDHGTGVVIGETTVIGQRVKLYQGVTLGALSTRGGQGLRGKKRHPTLENDVTVYPGASILGGETVIGEGATITSNAFVTQSVPAHTRVSVKSPELQFKGGVVREFKQELVADWQI